MSEIDIKKISAEKAKEIDDIIEKYIPKKYDKNSLIFTLGEPSYEYNVEAVQKAIADPIWEFLDRGGKRWRPVLFLLIAEAIGGNVKDISHFIVFPEIEHSATLVHDDIEDMSELRRGKPCLHKIYGMDVAINTGDVMYFLPFLTLLKNKHKFSNEVLVKAYEIVTQELIRVAFGQATDIAWHNGLANADNISEEEYLQMCSNKTGCMARMSAKLAALLSGADNKTIETLGRFAETVGIAFQIQDDTLSVVGDEFAEKKGYGDDITEGKRSLLVIHTLQKTNENDRKRLIEILNMHTTDKKLIDEAIFIIKKYGSVEYAKEKARKMVEDIWKEADKLLKPSDAKEKLKAFAYYLIERKI